MERANTQRMRVATLFVLCLHAQADPTSKSGEDEVCMLQAAPPKLLKSSQVNDQEQHAGHVRPDPQQSLPSTGDPFDIHFDLTDDPELVPALLQFKAQVLQSDSLSTTLKCILNLCFQYFAVYTTLNVVKAWNRIKGSQPGFWEKTLASATSTVGYAPMLGVLFLGTRIRAIQLTQGDTEKYGLPQWWAQIAMHFCALAVLGQLLFVVLVAVVTEDAPETDEDGNMKPAEQGVDLDTACLGWFFESIRYLLMLGMYGGAAVVCVALFLMEGPKEIFGEGTPPVSPAVSCTMNLTVQYFVIYFVLAACRTANKMMGRSQSKASDVMQLAANTVNYAPMLCVLFLAARLRALQIDPVNGNPQYWAQICFYLCTYSVLLQTVMVIAVPYLAGGEPKKGSSEGDISFDVESSGLSMALTTLRWMAMLCLYGGFPTIIASVLLIQNEENPALTPKVSTTMQCVMNLSVQFFALHLAHWLCVSLGQMSRSTEADESPKFVLETLESAQHTVAFCPMLCVLFVGTRMRALQLTDNKGSPQGWVQDSMQVAAWSVLAQLVMVVVPACIAYKSKGIKESTTFCNVVESLRLVCVGAMLGGALIVAYGACQMTAETANGRGGLLPSVN